MMRPLPRGSSSENTLRAASSSDGQSGTSTKHVYHGHHSPSEQVGEEYTVTVDGDTLPKRYDLLSASPSGYAWAYSGSGPAQLAIAILAHAYDDEFATMHYQQFKREVVSELPEDRWTLRTPDLDAWRREVIDDA